MAGCCREKAGRSGSNVELSGCVDGHQPKRHKSHNGNGCQIVALAGIMPLASGQSAAQPAQEKLEIYFTPAVNYPSLGHRSHSGVTGHHPFWTDEVAFVCSIFTV
jgi:hypothetical protein